MKILFFESKKFPVENKCCKTASPLGGRRLNRIFKNGRTWLQKFTTAFPLVYAGPYEMVTTVIKQSISVTLYLNHVLVCEELEVNRLS